MMDEQRAGGAEKGTGIRDEYPREATPEWMGHDGKPEDIHQATAQLIYEAAQIQRAVARLKQQTAQVEAKAARIRLEAAEAELLNAQRPMFVRPFTPQPEEPSE